VYENDKEDIVKLGQNARSKQTPSKKETLKKQTQSSEDSTTKFLTSSSATAISCRLQEQG